MSNVDLPHALEDYFAHAEVEPTREGRRFCITLPYLHGTRLDRLQWWWQLGTVKEQIVGEAGVAELRGQAIERFRRHVQQWLFNNNQRLHGDGPIPRLGTLLEVVAWPHDKVANG